MLSKFGRARLGPAPCFLNLKLIIVFSSLIMNFISRGYSFCGIHNFLYHNGHSNETHVDSAPTGNNKENFPPVNMLCLYLGENLRVCHRQSFPSDELTLIGLKSAVMSFTKNTDDLYVSFGFKLVEIIGGGVSSGASGGTHSGSHKNAVLCDVGAVPAEAGRCEGAQAVGTTPRTSKNVSGQGDHRLNEQGGFLQLPTPPREEGSFSQAARLSLVRLPTSSSVAAAKPPTPSHSPAVGVISGDGVFFSRRCCPMRRRRLWCQKLHQPS